MAFKKGGRSFDRGSQDRQGGFSDGKRSFDRGPRSFDRGPRSFDRGSHSSDRGPRSFDKRGSEGNRFLMHAAVCAKCQSACEVPFKPFPGQEVFCNNCFSKDGVNSPTKSFSRNNAPRQTSVAPAEVPQVLKLELNQIHSKIDKILSLVQKMAPQEVVEIEEAVEEVEEEVKEAKKSFTPKLFRKKN